MKLDSLKALYVHELDELHNGQGLLLKALPRLAQAAFSEELRLTFERYFGLAQDHSRRLDRIFSLLREWPTQTTCKTMKAILDEPFDLNAVARFIFQVEVNRAMNFFHATN